MSWKSASNFLQTMTFRLTIWYLVVFSVLSVAVFLVVYVSLTFRLQDQADYELFNELKEFSELYQARGISVLQTEFVREAESQGTGQVLFQLRSADGTILASSDRDNWKGIDTDRPDKQVIDTTGKFYSTISLPEQEYKVRLLALTVDDKKILEGAILLSREERILERYRETFGIALMIMIGCGGLFGFLLARKAMAGVQRVTDTALSIGRNELGRRVELTHEGEEIDALVRAFNGMLERIEGLLGELRQVTDNVAHELRTPVTRIRGMAETTLKGEDDVAEYKEMAAMVINGCDDLIEMITTMLEIAQTDSGTVEMVSVPLDLHELVEEAVDLFNPVAEDNGIGLTLANASRSVMISGDRRKLQRAVANLVDNGIKYSTRGDTITLTVGIQAGMATVEIADTGIGIDENDLPHIFERFYRADKSRSTTGNGLGLALAQAIVHAHQGDIKVESSKSGSIFTLLLPMTSPTRLTA